VTAAPRPDADPSPTAASRRAAAQLQDCLRDHFGPGRMPRTGITMGSGLSGLAARIENPIQIAYSDLEGWPVPTVRGHSGHVVAGELGGVPVIGFSGRVHLYEGGDPPRVGFYVRVAGMTGVSTLVISNAAGAINDGFAPGELMLLRDHINLTGTNPLAGPARPREPRFPDMTAAYDQDLRDVFRECAAELGTTLHEGVYAAVHGPSYETPAEIRMLRTLGADAVGMSTVPEVIVARATGIRCAAVSCLTNHAAGITGEPLSHQEVIQVGRQCEVALGDLVALAVGRLSEPPFYGG